MTRKADRIDRQLAARRRQEEVWRPQAGSGFRQVGMALVWAGLISAPILGIGVRMIYGTHAAKVEATRAAMELETAHERLLAGAPGTAIPEEDALRGREVFANTCAACHGATGTGVAGLGKDLRTSDFVASLGDDDLHEFFVTGRPEARPVAMPARGGNPDLTDDDLSDLVAYVRGLQDPRRMPQLPERVVASAAPSEAETAAALEAAGGDAELAEYIASGRKLFANSCAACHGKDATGIAGNGKTLVDSAFCDSLDDDELLAFIMKGRDPSDPLNTTGVGMPAKGGNPALSEDDLLDIIDYLRSLKPAEGGAMSRSE